MERYLAKVALLKLLLGLQSQADTQTTVTMLSLAGLHVLDKKNKNKKTFAR